MIGKYRIIVQNKRIRYDFEIKRNLTIIRGDSATGKTTMVDMVGDFINNPSGGAVELSCDKKCFVVEGATWQGQISSIHDSIIFIDEGNEFVNSEDFAKAVKESDDYFVIVTRQDLPQLPYSVDEIYGIRNSGKYGTLKRTYNEFYRIYADIENKDLKLDVIITEDSNSGYQFMKAVGSKNNMKCISAEGKSNVFYKACEEKAALLIFVDGAAFGPEMERVYELALTRKNIIIYLPESFEWLILKSNILNESDVGKILNNPENYIHSEEYMSWERFFTHLLIQKTLGTYLEYSKSKLNNHYLDDRIINKICNEMPSEIR